MLHRTSQLKRTTGLLLLGLPSLLLAGCSPPKYATVAGKYSRTPRYPATKYRPAYSYTNTTELKANGAYTITSDREGTVKVLETGYYEIEGNVITYHSDSFEFPGQKTVGRIRNGVLDSGRFARRKEGKRADSGIVNSELR